MGTNGEQTRGTNRENAVGAENRLTGGHLAFLGGAGAEKRGSYPVPVVFSFRSCRSLLGCVAAIGATLGCSRVVIYIRARFLFLLKGEVTF